MTVRCLGVKRALKWLFLVSFVLLPLISFGQAQGPLNGPGTLTDDYRVAITQWIRLFISPAQRLFWLLAGLEFSWVAIKLAIQQADFQEFAATMIRRVMWIGTFYAILVNGINVSGGGWIPDIINSFSSLGKSAAGIAWANPDVIVGLGVNAAGDLLHSAGQFGLLENPGTIAALFFDACVVFVAYLGVAVQFVVVLVESYLVIGAGVILLGLGGSRWTVGYTERFIGSVVAIGFKLLVLYLIIATGMTLSQQWVRVAQNIANSPSPSRTGFDLCAAAVVFLCVAWKAPGIAAGILGGHSALSGGDLVGTGSALAAGTASGAAVVATGGAAAAAIAARAPAAISRAAQFGITASKATASGINAGASTVVKPPSASQRGALSTVNGAGVTGRSALNTPRNLANTTRPAVTRVQNTGGSSSSSVTTPRGAGLQTASSQPAPESPATDGGGQISSANSPPPEPYVPPPARWRGYKTGDGLRNVANAARRIKSHIARMQPPHDGGGTGSGSPPFGGEKGGEGEGE